MRARVAVVAVLLAGAALIAWLALRAPDKSASDIVERSARPRPSRAPREPQRDDELAAMLAELMRIEVDPSDGVDELERLERAQAVGADSRENDSVRTSIPPPPEASELLLGAERVPNVARVERLDGPFVSADWPNGTVMFEARQALDEDGAWRLDGGWRAWYANAQLEELGGYVQGFEHGPWSWWYSNGALMARGRFDEGVRVGEWAFWHPNGVVIGEGAYDEGRRTGRWVFRGADGRVHEGFSGNYEFGERVGP